VFGPVALCPDIAIKVTDFSDADKLFLLGI
jgi:hypothetical protein